MKILAVSDFHGKFPSKIKKIIKKQKIDLSLISKKRFEGSSKDERDLSLSYS